MVLSIPIVLIILFKYSLNIEKMESDGDPTETIYGDKYLILLGLIYVIFLVILIYFI